MMMGDNRKENKKENRNEGVKALYVPLCEAHRDCCMNDPGCRAQIKYYPDTDQKILDSCGC